MAVTISPRKITVNHKPFPHVRDHPSTINKWQSKREDTTLAGFTFDYQFSPVFRKKITAEHQAQSGAAFTVCTVGAVV